MPCSNCNDVTTPCVDGKTPAPCLFWEIPANLQSWYDDEECILGSNLFSQFTTTFQTIEDAIDYSGSFGDSCLTYPAGTLTPVSVAETQDAAICSLQEDVEELQDICNILNKNISGCGIDTSCWEGQTVCDNPIDVSTLKKLLQTIVTKICELESA